MSFNAGFNTIFNDTTGKFVMWMHVDFDDYADAGTGRNVGVSLRGDLAIDVAHRAGNPGHVVAAGKAPERRNETAAPALGLAGSIRPVLIGDRTPVRDDDDLSPLAHAIEAY